MKTYKYQMHIHTNPCSRCGMMTPASVCQALYEGGYQGAVLTNHFLHGNTGIDRDLPWDKFIEAYERDYLECKRAAEKYDLDILFGIEEVVEPGLEILCYGLTPEILYNNPELGNWGVEAWSALMRKNGVVLIQAHPYREAGYIPNPGPLPLEYVDGIEVYNHCNSRPDMNEKAMHLAEENPHLITVSGGDAHWVENVPFGGIVTKKRIRNEKMLAKILKKRKFTPIIP